MRDATHRAVDRADPRLLRRGSRRAGVPRGRRPARARRFAALEREDGELAGALPPRHQPRPVGRRLRGVRRAGGAIGAADADRRAGRRRRALGAPPADGSAAPREDRPGSPSTSRRRRRSPVGPGCAPRRRPTSTCSSPPAPRRTTRSSASIRCDATRTGSAGARASQIEEGRSWLWVEDGVILFKAEASAWTPEAVQLQQVWVDPPARRQGHASRGAPRPDPAAARRGPRRLPLRARRERRRDPPLRDGRDAARARLPQRPAVSA